MKRLFESYKDYFRLGAAISGIILMNDDEKAVCHDDGTVPGAERRFLCRGGGRGTRVCPEGPYGHGHGQGDERQ